MRADSWLLLRHGGCLWAISGERVAGVDRPGRGYRLRVGASLLLVDEVLSFTTLHQRRPFGPVLGPIAPAGCSGLALCELGPVLIIDACSPPAVLLAPATPPDQGETNHDADS